MLFSVTDMQLLASAARISPSLYHYYPFLLSVTADWLIGEGSVFYSSFLFPLLIMRGSRLYAGKRRKVYASEHHQELMGML
jgi:hypothetical protein